MRRIIPLQRLVALVVLSVFVSACQQSNGTQDLSAATSKLSAEVALMQEQLQALDARLTSAESEFRFHKLLQDVEKIAYLTPGSEGYAVIGMELGYLVVSLEDVKPYANGSRIVLRFGNTTSAQIDGATASVEWGRLNEEGSPDNEAAKTREVKFSKSLSPGKWTDVTISLEGVPADEFGFVRVKNLTHTAIRLGR